MTKKLFLLLALSFVLLIGLNSKDVAAAQIPMQQTAGTYTITGGGSLAFCFDSSLMETPCTGPSVAIVFPQTLVQLGEVTGDGKGNSCSTFTETISDLPVDSSPPFVFPASHSVGLSGQGTYDPATGVGDLSGTNYTGGTCNGAIFDKTGATLTGTFTVHFIVSDNGKRLRRHCHGPTRLIWRYRRLLSVLC
jgi:hypothetical protein